MSHVFISYVRENEKIVQRLCDELTSHWIKVWLDRNDIAPGIRWKQAIQRAIKQGAFFIACFSKEYSGRDKTYMNEELILAIEELRQRPTDQTWFIPVKISQCEIPDRDIGAGETLGSIQWIKLYEDWESGIKDLLNVVKPTKDELNSLALATFYRNESSFLMGKGNYKKGAPLAQKCLEAYRRIGDSRNMAWTYSGIVGSLFNSGDIEEAEEHARVSLEKRERIGNTVNIAYTQGQLGDILMCRRQWQEAILYYEKSLEGCRGINDPLQTAKAHLRLGKAHLSNRSFRQAVRYFQKAAEESVENEDRLSRIFEGIEEAYMALGMREKFVDFCISFKERHIEAVGNFSWRQWYQEPAFPSKALCCLTFVDDFLEDKTDTSWDWIDAFGDCAASMSIAEGIEIRAANGRNLHEQNLSAPRLMREISGNFAAEVSVLPTSDKEPHMGGILGWKDRDNFLCFEKGVHRNREVRLRGCVNGRYQIAGSGLLWNGGNKKAHLRLERSDEHFSAYCSADRKDWFTCGTMTLPMDDPIHIGIYAIGAIDRTIYCGAFKNGTATLFRNFRILTRS